MNKTVRTMITFAAILVLTSSTAAVSPFESQEREIFESDSDEKSLDELKEQKEDDKDLKDIKKEVENRAERDAREIKNEDKERVSGAATKEESTGFFSKIMDIF